METKTEIGKIDCYVEVFKEIMEKVNDKEISIAILSEIGKDRRCELANKARNSAREPMATRKQLSYLESLGVSFSENLTKKEASDLIEKTKAERGI